MWDPQNPPTDTDLDLSKCSSQCREDAFPLICSYAMCNFKRIEHVLLINFYLIPLFFFFFSSYFQKKRSHGEGVWRLRFLKGFYWQQKHVYWKVQLMAWVCWPGWVLRCDLWGEFWGGTSSELPDPSKLQGTELQTDLVLKLDFFPPGLPCCVPIPFVVCFHTVLPQKCFYQVFLSTVCSSSLTSFFFFF